MLDTQLRSKLLSIKHKSGIPKAGIPLLCFMQFKIQNSKFLIHPIFFHILKSVEEVAGSHTLLSCSLQLNYLKPFVSCGNEQTSVFCL